MNKKVAIAQIEVRTGDITGNTKRIINGINNAINCGFIVFPEMTISGYNCGDLFEKEQFINDCTNALYKIVDESKNHKDLVIIIGCPRLDNSKLYNSAYVIQNGIVVDHYDKQLLANDYHHEDRKYFTAGHTNKIFYLNGVKFGIILCEDGWTENGYGRDITRELNNEGVDIIFSLNYSYFTYDKVMTRELTFKNKNCCPIVYVNCVGIGDITKNFICYDGNSFYTAGYGNLQYINDCSFEEAFEIVDFDDKLVITNNHINSEKFNNIYNAIKYSQKKIFEQCGIKVAQVHISGGIDSALVGYFAVEAMGKENVVFITQPSKNNGEKTLKNAQDLADTLGVKLEYDPIIEYVAMYKKNNEGCSKAQVASFEATLRKSLGFSYTHKNKSGIVACGNHTENVLGFFGFGDIGSMGVYQPIGDLTKTEIYELSEYINTVVEKREVIPACLYNGQMKPAAELEDNNEDPFDYKIMSIICEKIIRNGLTPSEIFRQMSVSSTLIHYSKKDILDNINKAWTLSKRSVFKRAQSAPVLILSNRSIGFSSRETIINYYK